MNRHSMLAIKLQRIVILGYIILLLTLQEKHEQPRYPDIQQWESEIAFHQKAMKEDCRKPLRDG
jgi:hypothetical protein